jgi:hypothetical protein
MVAVRCALKLQLSDLPSFGPSLVSMACDIVPVNMRVSLGERIANSLTVDKLCIEQCASVYPLWLFPSDEL